MANLIIKPKLAADSFQMKDAGSNVILTVEGQTDSTDSAAGRIIYGKGVNETKGDISQGATSKITLDLATGTFFEHLITQQVDTWEIDHIPASGTVAAWVVRLKQKASGAVTNAWIGDSTSSYDNSGTWSSVTPVFHWAGGTDHIMSTGVNEIDVIAFWTFDGGAIIYSTISGQAFAT